MKALILAAGSGKRLRPFTLSESKALFPFLGKPLLLYHIEEFSKHNFNQFIIVCNRHNYDKIREFKENLPYDIELCIQDPPSGPAHAIYSARDLLIKEDFFLIKYCDSMALQDQIQPILRTFAENPQDAVVTLRHVENPAQYGIAIFDGERLVGFVEKPQSDFPSDLAYVGLTILNTRKFFEILDSEDFQSEVVPVEYMLQKGHRVSWWIFEGERVDLGYPWDIISMNSLLIRKYGGRRLSTKISHKAQIDDDVYIGPQARIFDDVTISKYSSIEGVLEKGASVNNSFIMKGAQVGEFSHLEYSVIGKNAKLGTRFTAHLERFTDRRKNKRRDTINLGCYIADDVILPDFSKIESGKIVFPDFSKIIDVKKDI